MEAKALAPPPEEDLLYAYLTSVYSAVRQWRSNGSAVERQLRTYAKRRFHQRLKLELFRIAIELTAKPHVNHRMKGKYAAALERAQQEGIRPPKLKKFIQDNGGLNEVIRKFKISKK